MRAEGIIQSMDDVRLVTICPSGTCVDVWLRNADFEPPQRHHHLRLRRRRHLR
ncbi:MAG: hypothetical protein IPO34_18505 [Dehalococcoidia bacterium]|nr:hypothetical protein [Dehalococcoidia bacterium]